MEGIIIYDDYRGKKVVEAIKLGEVVYNCKIGSSDDAWMNELSGIRKESTQAYCNESDTYDFETGALIALMKMCGVEKVVRACNEAFSEDTFKTYAIKFERELNELKKDFDKVRELKEFYKKNYEDVKEHYGKLGDRNKYLIEDINKKLEYIKEKDEEIKNLKKEKEQIIVAKGILIYNKLLEENSHLKYTKSCNESTIESLENTRDLLIGENEKLKSDCDKYFKEVEGLVIKKNELEEENEKLKKENYLWENSDKSLRREVKIVRDALNTWKKRYRDLNTANGDLVCENYKLKAENEKLKTDCEKLKHGYIDTDMTNPCPADWDGDILNMVFLPGRCCGKQYTALVELFKKIDQKKVDAAYKEAYDTTLPVWQKEFLKQACSIHKESKEKIELPRTLDINGTVYRKSIQIKDFGEQITKLTVDSLIEQSRAFRQKCVDEWLYKNPTKREEMWGEILELHKTNDVIIEVKKEDVTTFLHEIENRIPEITWGSGVKIFETKYTIKDVYFELKSHDVIYFRLSRATKLTYTSDPHIYPYRELKIIDYLPPMRWDLFEKGRLVVKVNKENYAEFCSRVLSHFDKVGVHAFNHACKFGYFRFNKDTDYVERLLSSDHGDAKEINRRKVVDWEDVR